MPNILILLIFIVLNCFAEKDRKEAKRYFDEGYKLYFKGDFEQALINFKKAAELDPTNYSYFFYIGKTHEKLTNIPEATEAFKKAVEILPDNKHVLYCLAEVLYKDKKYIQAEEVLKRILKIDKDYFHALFLLGKVNVTIHDADEAIEYLEHATFMKEEPEVFFLLGKAYLHKLNYKKAILNFDRAILLETNNPVYYFERANAYFASKDYMAEDDEFWRSAKDYRKTIEFGLERPEVYFMYGNSFLYRALYYIKTARSDLALNLFEKAIIAYKETIKKDPKASNAYNNIGLCYYFLNKFEQAIDMFKKAIDIEPTIAFFHDNIGETYYKRSEFKEAIKHWELVLELEPEYKPGNLDGLLPFQKPIEQKIKDAKRRL